jgi:glycosyltransferase involved in cell wall biosynthesis
MLDILREGNAALYDDGQRSMVFPLDGAWGRAAPVLRKVEFYLWLLIHGINPVRVQIIKELETLGEGDVLFSFYIGRADVTGSSSIEAYQHCKAMKLMHLTHCMFRPELGAANIAKLRVFGLVAEADISENGFFKKYFGQLRKPFYLLPYAFDKRFSRNVMWEERKAKCAATGTFQNIAKEAGLADFRDFFKTDTFHPMRRKIFENRERLKDLLEVRMSDLDAEIEPSTGKHPMYKGSRLRKAYAFAYTYYDERLRPFHGRRKYYDFNIVDFYNAHKLFVVPEEYMGFPSIGFVEGMACGTAFIGLDHPMYRDLGLLPGVHYISYDGSLEDLIEKIHYYLGKDDLLRSIATNGYNFVTANFSKEKVKQRFFDDLLAMQKSKSVNFQAKTFSIQKPPH